MAFSSASDTVGLVLCAGILIRLRDRSREPGVVELCRRVLQHRRVTSLVLLAASSTFVRLVGGSGIHLRMVHGVDSLPTARSTMNRSTTTTRASQAKSKACS